MEGRIYSVTLNNASIINGTALGTLIQIATPATIGIEIIRAWAGQVTTTTSAQQAIEIVRKSGAATVTSATPSPFNKQDPASLCIGGAALTGTIATAEGTDSTILYADAFSLLNGWLWVPTPTDRITVNISAFIGLKLLTVPAGTTTWSAGIVFKELT